VKVVFSGRLFEDQLEGFRKFPVEDVIEVKAFDKEIAVEYLQAQGLDKPASERLAQLEMLPLRPLELKLIAGLIRDGSATLEDLEKDLDENDGSKGVSELFSGLVYRRVLLRIREPLLREIAYPGLILRYLTPEIVQKVLQPALGLQGIDEAKANQIVEDLAKYSWLAYKKDGAVWHSKEMRRTMLKLMMAQEKDRVMDVRMAAMDYFIGKATLEAASELMYHALMMFDEKMIENAKIETFKTAYPLVVADIADLPRRSAVLLEYAGTGKINDSDVHLLPKKYFLEAYNVVGERLVKNRQFQQALRLFQHKESLKGDTERESELHWESELLFHVAEWRLAENKGKKRSGAVWMVTGSPDKEKLQDLLKDLIRKNTSFGERVYEPEFITSLSQMCYALAHLHVRNETSPILRELSSTLLNILSSGEWSPGIEKSLFILEIMHHGKPPWQAAIEASLLKLDPEWLLWLTGYIIPDFQGKFRQAHSYVSSEHQWDLANFLTRFNSFDSAYSVFKTGDDSLLVNIQLDHLDRSTVYDLVRGPDPIFRDPCRYAVLDAFTTQEQYRELASIIQQVVKVRLTDLNPEVFAQSMESHAEATLEGFIELIDRTWALGDFLRLVHAQVPAHEKVQWVLEAYEKWEETFRKLVVGS
jgi:hypothetical protein